MTPDDSPSVTVHDWLIGLHGLTSESGLRRRVRIANSCQGAQEIVMVTTGLQPLAVLVPVLRSRASNL